MAKILILHPNFPAQFKNICLHFSKKHEVRFLCQTHYDKQLPKVERYTLKGTGDFNYTSVGTHHVSKGDTLGGIARKYKVSIEDLKEFNELDSHIIIIGTTIDIPQ